MGFVCRVQYVGINGRLVSDKQIYTSKAWFLILIVILERFSGFVVLGFRGSPDDHFNGNVDWYISYGYWH